MASVRETPSGRFQGVAKHPSGKRSTRVFDGKRAARKWAQDVEDGWRRTGGFRDPRAGKLLLGDWYEMWHAARVVAPNTAEREQRIHKRYVLPKWESWPLESITRIEVRGWVAQMLKGGVSPQQIHLAFWALSAMLRDAAGEEPPLILGNPCARIPLPPLPPPRERFFSAAEARAILAELREPWRTMAELSLWTGLRWEEMAGLHGSEVDWMRGTVHMRAVRDVAGDREGAKSAPSVRRVPMPPWVVESMSRLMVGRDRAERVFINRGAPCKYNTWLVAFRTACARAGVEYAPPHTLRHTAASWLAEAGVDQYRIQGLLGHATARQTKRYSHLGPAAHGKIRDAWDGIAAEFGRTTGACDAAAEDA